MLTRYMAILQVLYEFLQPCAPVLYFEMEKARCFFFVLARYTT